MSGYLIFKKLSEYYGWDPIMQLKEFKMAMFGNADIWLSGLHEHEKSTVDNLLVAFKEQYGGENDKMSYSIHMLDIIQQGTEPMINFGPKLRSLVMNVCPNNNPLQQLYYFNRCANLEVFKAAVKPSRPKNINEAISFALGLERTFQEPDNSQRNNNNHRPRLIQQPTLFSKSDMTVIRGRGYLFLIVTLFKSLAQGLSNTIIHSIILSIVSFTNIV